MNVEGIKKKTAVRIAGDLAGIQTVYLLNTSLKYHCNTTLVSDEWVKNWLPLLTITHSDCLTSLTTFWRSKSSLSHLRRVTSCRSASACLPPASPVSEQRLQALWGVSALDMLSRPVSLSTYTAASRSTLFNDESSLSDNAGLKCNNCNVQTYDV